MNRMMTRRSSRLLLCAALFSLALLPPDARAQRGSQTVTGTVIGMGGRLGGRSLPFRLIVNSHSSAGDVQEVSDALRRGGQDELLRAFSRLDAGRIQIGNNIGVTANVIVATPQPEGGTKLTVLYERNVRFFELRHGTRSADYRVGYAELFLDRNGRGQGTFIPAARVRLRDGNTWEVEDFGEFPARLLGLRSSGRVAPR